MEKIVIEKKQTTAVKLLTLDLFLMLLSLLAWLYGKKERLIIMRMSGLFALIVLAIAFFVFLGHALESKPLLTITFDGIIDSTTSGSVGYIPFQDIENFTVTCLMSQKVIGIIPKDEDAFIEKLSPLKQKAALENLRLKYPPMSIRVDKAKDMSLEDIYTLLTKRLKDYSSLYD